MEAPIRSPIFLLIAILLVFAEWMWRTRFSHRGYDASAAFASLGVAFGNSRVLVFSGIAYAAICLLVLCSRSVRNLPRRTAEPEVPVPAG